MTSPAMYGSLLETPILKSLSTVAIHTHLHGEMLSAIKILADFFHRTMAIRTLDVGREMETMMKYYMFRKNLLVSPREFLGFREKGVQLLNSWFFRQGKPVTIQTIFFGGHIGMRLVSNSRMAMGAI